MCGIAGIVSNNEVAPILQRMTAQVAHRGPDGEGHFVEGNLGLGHRRLAIVDLSRAGAQPMHYLDRYVITYNGEVYNHLELRKELEREGYSFTSSTDTEVIAAAFDCWGEAFLERLNGMWAFAIFDRARRELFCARDRFGIKPFHYWISPNGDICFGSEVKQFMVHPQWTAKLQKQQAYDFLVWGAAAHTDATLFEGVFSLEQGHALRLSLDRPPTSPDGRLPTRRWYRLRENPFDGSFEEASAEFRRLFVDAVSLRLRSDVPVGSCLSGGVDSSAVVGTVAQIRRTQGGGIQRTFSICSSDPRLDERRWMDLVVSRTNVDAHFSYPELEELIEKMKQITWHQEVPTPAAGVLMQWEVMSLARSHQMKVLLDGQGSDEYLAGYHSFFAAHHARLLLTRSFKTLRCELQHVRDLHGQSVMESIRGMAQRLAPRKIRGFAQRRTADPDWLDVKRMQVRTQSPYTEASTFASSISELSQTLLTSTNLPILLHWEDRNSMAHSIEARVPFLDYRLVEFALGLPDEYKIRNGMTKYVLRHALADLLPSEVSSRVDKRGFIAPEESYLRRGGGGHFRTKIQHAIEASNGLVKPSSLDILDEIIQTPRAYNQIPWRIVSFFDWLQAFDVRVAT